MGGRGSSAGSISGSSKYDGTVKIPFEGTVSAKFGRNIKIGDRLKLGGAPGAEVLSIKMPAGRSKKVVYTVVNPMTGRSVKVTKNVDDLVGVE